jgi:hypothetical protein
VDVVSAPSHWRLLRSGIAVVACTGRQDRPSSSIAYPPDKSWPILESRGGRDGGYDQTHNGIRRRCAPWSKLYGLLQGHESAADIISVWDLGNSGGFVFRTIMYRLTRQNFSGNTFSNYSTYFFEQAGLGGTAAYDFALGQYAINTVGVFGAWALMSAGIGRRTLFVYGLCGLCLTLLVIGFVGIARGRAEDRTIGLVTGSLMLVWAAIYQTTVG